MASDVRPSKRFNRREDTENTSTNKFENYDVFISHRGPDTKTGFVSFLYRDLESAGLKIFLDCRSIKTGEDAWECIENAIKKSRIAVVVFSEYFAASEWCLRELDAILGVPNIKVVPIFYNVRPSEVRFIESSKNKTLQDDFKKLSGRHNKRTIERWTQRLEEASKLMGLEHPRESKRLEAEFLLDIVGEILALANKPLPLDVGDCVVGVKQVAEEIIQILEIKKEVLMLGLWGMGGIGKSTLARELFNQMSKGYDSACYVEDVTEMVNKGGVVKVQQQIMKDLCKNNLENIEGKSKGKRILEERLCKKRFLLVLDDVCDNDEMEYWISRKMLTEGSTCIVTSRNKSIFEKSTSFDVEREVYIYDVKGLSIEHSKRVFISYSFGSYSRMKPGFEELVSSISKLCGGVPLVLKVCGALLKNKENVEVWREVLAKLNQGTIMDEKKIFECLRISYDVLSLEQQEMFLDIACALIGERKDRAVRVWKTLKGSPELGIYSLIEKALITVDKAGCLRMHDHLRDMGREIVRMKSASDGIIRGLWMPKSLTLVCKNEELLNSIQTLVLSTYTNDDTCDDSSEDGTFEVMIDLDVSHMKSLRILMCDSFVNILSSLPKSIRWFRHSYGKFIMLPKSFGELRNLKVLDLKACDNLTMLPGSFGQLSSLEVLNLSQCSKLTTLPKSFGSLRKMQKLELSGSGIESLRESFRELSNLEVLNLSGCRKLTMLSRSFGSLRKMQKLELSCSGIQSLPESFGELSNLEVLDLSGCSKLTMLPKSFGSLRKMQKLELSGSEIGSLPESFGELSNLEVLNLSRCRKLTMLPKSFGSLRKMRKLELQYSEIESLPESFGELSNLEVLDLSQCSKLTMLPKSFGSLRKMQKLELQYSEIESLPESFGELSNLEVLDLSGCSKLTMLPKSFGGLRKMQKLELQYSEIESLPESFGELSNLEVLNLSGCSKLTMLAKSFGGLRKMQKLLL